MFGQFEQEEEPEEIDFRELATKKVGPLPLFAWGALAALMAKAARHG